MAEGMSIDDATPGEWDAANARVWADRVDNHEWQRRAEQLSAIREAVGDCCGYRTRAEAAEAELAHEFGMRTAWQYRAKAAEAERDELDAIVGHCKAVVEDWEAAEARIAAALELCEQDWDGFAWWDVAASIKSALTGCES